MKAGGRTYYSSSGGSSNVINGVFGASLAQRWTVGGKCAKGSHMTQWSAKLNGRFECDMEPYPGNELPLQ